MTQSDIIKLLYKNQGEFFSAEEITKQINKASIHSIKANLGRLRRHGEVDFKVIENDRHIYGIAEKKEEV